eukprot:470677_1
MNTIFYAMKLFYLWVLPWLHIGMGVFYLYHGLTMHRKMKNAVWSYVHKLSGIFTLVLSIWNVGIIFYDNKEMSYTENFMHTSLVEAGLQSASLLFLALCSLPLLERLPKNNTRTHRFFAYAILLLICESILNWSLNRQLNGFNLNIVENIMCGVVIIVCIIVEVVTVLDAINAYTDYFCRSCNRKWIRRRYSFGINKENFRTSRRRNSAGNYSTGNRVFVRSARRIFTNARLRDAEEPVSSIQHNPINITISFIVMIVVPITFMKLAYNIIHETSCFDRHIGARLIRYGIPLMVVPIYIMFLNTLVLQGIVRLNPARLILGITFLALVPWTFAQYFLLSAEEFEM